ncbi:glycosyltransferase family 32 protein [Geothrix sp. PMB-07]|uniref:glycosyltransferase family 32 protein n=1 Tax=Geothrix sp. PMB-07 TaxID=3068640 RepID=UPI002740B857|nr:glycosyltransferase [Geothrix sp. PMB-07]WLT31787.1 glycosyltransferase [Geothrix sp. PMB-07]
MIPKIIHLIWVGDESKRPNRFIQTWVDHHPDWEVKLWGNEDLAGRRWINGHHMEAMAKREWNGVADMMRWEILHEEGGVLVDADSCCVRPLPAWLLECEAFASWENELARPRLIAAGYFGTIPGTRFLATLIEGLRKQPTVTDRDAWQSVGPLYLTQTWIAENYSNLTVLPSHFFMPEHYTGLTYTGSGPVYAKQAWASTLGTYDTLADAAGGTAPGVAGTTPTPQSQAFLLEPDRGSADWEAVLLSYVQAFTADDPVALLLLANPASARASLDAALKPRGQATPPSIVWVEQAADLWQHLRAFQQVSWVRPDSKVIQGLRGTWGSRLAQSWQGQNA